MPSPLLVRLKALAAELAKFAVVGGFCFVLDVALANLFHFALDIGPTTSKTMSTVIATFVSYLGNRLWSFAHRVDETSSHKQDLSVYAAINVVGLVITLVPVDVAHYLLGLTSPLAFNVSGALGTAVATGFRFWAYRRYVFAGSTEPAERVALV